MSLPHPASSSAAASGPADPTAAAPVAGPAGLPSPVAENPVVQTPALADLRLQIDTLDAQLLALLNQRARVAEQVGAIKRAEGSPFFRPDRVAQVIEGLQARNAGPLLNQHVGAIWREIMSACLALEAPQRVAVLGPAGTFSETSRSAGVQTLR